MNGEQRQRLVALRAAQKSECGGALKERGLDAESGATARALDVQPVTPARQSKSEPPRFSLFFFSDDGNSHDEDKYGLVLEAARFADANRFHAIWVPERHFHSFGGLYPNPATLAAAIAAITQHVGIRAGSVVLPLHHPARVAEDWAVVDNLSRGRVGVSFASGWVPEDFVLGSTVFEERRRTALERLETVRRLWRGEAVEFALPGHSAPVPVRTYPRPLQPDLPVWITTAGTRETWTEAGRLGVNVLTGLLQGSLAHVAGNVIEYRRARAASGQDPDAGCVTLMIHTFLDRDATLAHERARGPLRSYLRDHLSIYETQKLTGARLQANLSTFGREDKEALADFACERYLRESGIFGTPASCLPAVEAIHRSGIDEIGCLIDFGLDRRTVIEGLRYLAELRDEVNRTFQATPGDAHA
jgi:natural product biosynthesis luciferase-like monooxygenase protein